MNLRPLRDRIVVEPIERVKSKILQVIMDEKDNMGTVVALGPEAAKHLESGAFIRYGTMGNDEYLKYQEYFEGDKRYLIMSWKDVCFVQ
jgi:co-chaperonin GroES (HSP10)